jgi:hypothetical protein
MHKTLMFAVGAVFGVVLVATCGGKMGGAGDAGAQSGPTRMLTADTDVNQLAGATFDLTPGTPQKVADGPFVLTDALAAVNARLSAVTGTDCTQAGRIIGVAPFQGARWLIKDGESLCIATLSSGPDRITWSGFRPY